jgi:hypothetical protein
LVSFTSGSAQVRYAVNVRLSIRGTIMLGLLTWVSGTVTCAAAQVVPVSVDDCVRLAVARSPTALLDQPTDAFQQALALLV